MREKRKRKILGSTKNTKIAHYFMTNRDYWRIGRMRSLDSRFFFVLIINVIDDCQKKKRSYFRNV